MKKKKIRFTVSKLDGTGVQLMEIGEIKPKRIIKFNGVKYWIQAVRKNGKWIY